LIQAACSYNPETKLDVNTYTVRARQWGCHFIRVYDTMCVTPYIHVFVYHVGQFIIKARPPEFFSNYSTENKHQEAKKKKGGKRYETSMSARSAQILIRDLRAYCFACEDSKVVFDFNNFVSLKSVD
jgi:hypothetical protein